jgi:hypothetical protein
MKKLFLLLALITFVNCTKDDDDDVQFDPLYSKPDEAWFAEWEYETDDGDTAYYQRVLIATNGMAHKTKYSINNIDTYEDLESLGGKEGFEWTNNDPDCKPENCVNYNNTTQEYTFTPFNRTTQEYGDGFIAVIKFTDNFTKMTYNGRVYGITTRETYNDFDNDGDLYY